EVGRGDDPRVDRLLVVGRSHGKLGDTALNFPVEKPVVQMRELAQASARGERHVGRSRGSAGGYGNESVSRNAELAAAIGSIEAATGQPACDVVDRSVEANTCDVVAAMLVVENVDRFAVGSPNRAGDLTVKPGRKY